MRKAWTFGLPPSVGDTVTHAQRVSGALATIGCRVVRQALNYQALIRDLEDGRVQAAWAPPMVCAIVEHRRGRMMLRSVRNGATAYRAVLFGRAERKLSIDQLYGLRAVWPDAQSMSGFILPRGVMRAAGHEPESTFGGQRFLGSFAHCVQAVLDRKADVSSIYASAMGAPVARTGMEEIAGPRAVELASIAYSPNCPNDGVVLSPRITGGEALEFAGVFAQVATQPATSHALAEGLSVDGFDVPPPGAYDGLVEYLSNPRVSLEELLGG